jgi:glutamate/tyrosine decarboxylase-like PLP-dependent enzyme
MKPAVRADPERKEETLDPESWDAMRALGHRMVDEMMEYLERVRERPVWQPIPAGVKAALDAPLPLEPETPEQVYEQFRRDVLPYPLGNIHPRFWGWVIGTGTPLGVLAEMLAATMNSNVGGGEQIATYVEVQVLDWCKRMLRYPRTASGILVSGGSVANLIGIAVARNAKAEVDLNQSGIAAAPRRMVLYASSETHNSVRKAVALLGLGRESLREIPVDQGHRIDLTALRRAISADVAAGHHPFAVIGNAGTVNSGAIDDLEALADLCVEQRLWFHVDGAFGALAAISTDLAPRVRGMERADSLAFDLHKWMYVPYEAGCVLVRDPDHHRAAFTSPAEYLAHTDRGIASTDVWLSDYGPQLSRGFRALKIWMSFKEHGLAKYARLIEQNVEQAEYLGRHVEASPDLELLTPVSLNIVCFRFVAPGLSDEALDRVNDEILHQIQESGIAVPSSTRLGGRFAIRVAITNHRSRREDFDLLVREVVERGKSLASVVA